MKKAARDFFNEKVRRIAEKEGSLSRRIFERPVFSNGDIKKVHICGVCGKGTSSLAGLFTEIGLEVSGSDEGCYPPTDAFIKRLGIKFYEGYSEEHLKDKDLVVVANMFGPDNIEVKYAREHSLNQMSLPEATAEFFIKNKELGERTSIVISGTHGKTTTTGLAAHVFFSAGLNPGFLVGGEAVPTKNGIGETSFNAGDNKTKHFIIEGDEYDTAYFDKAPKFLHYRPDIAVVTSLEFDHVDIYKDLEEYRQSFIFLASELPSTGLLVLNGDSEEVRALSKHTEASVLYYGFNENTDVTAKDIVVDEKGQHFTLVYKGQDMGQYSIGLFGKYNLANALAVSAVAIHEKLSTVQLQEGLKTFLGMKRRQEIKAIINGITIIDDFAHHPTAVRETLSGIRDHFKNSRIIALFEPRSNTSRRKMFEHEYGKSFENVDALYLSMPELRHNDKPEDFIDGNVVIADARNMANNKDFMAVCVQNGDQALTKLVPVLKSGDVVVIMSNGSFDGVHEKLIASLYG